MKITIALVILAALFAPTQAHSIEVPQSSIVAPVLNPALQRPCACESTGTATGTPTQYDKNGDVLHGEINSHDIGMCQINNDWNGKQATEMGYDIYTESGNIRFANYMYETQGLQPWHWSKPCWGKD